MEIEVIAYLLLKENKEVVIIITAALIGLCADSNISYDMLSFLSE